MNRSYSKFLYPIIDFVQNKAREILASNDEDNNREYRLAKIMPVNINYNNENEQIQIVIVKEQMDDYNCFGTSSGIGSDISNIVTKCNFTDVDVENRNDLVFGFLHKMCNPSGFIGEIPFFNIYYKSVDDFYARCPV